MFGNMEMLLYICIINNNELFFFTLQLFIMNTIHYVFFDGCTHFVGSLEYDQTDDTEIVYKSSNFDECCEICDKLNIECAI